METKTQHFLTTEILQSERRVYLGSILTVSLGYLGLTLWLNAIRATANIWLVWILIIIQFSLYFLIFYISYKRSKVIGLGGIAFPIFIALTILGRVNDWEIIIIPLLIIVMLIFSFRTRNIPDKVKSIVSQ